MIPIYDPKPLGEDDKGTDLRIGWASWDKGRLQKKSVKYCYRATDGRIARTSPEVPLRILVEMVKYTLEKGELTDDQCNQIQEALTHRRR